MLLLLLLLLCLFLFNFPLTYLYKRHLRLFQNTSCIVVHLSVYSDSLPWGEALSGDPPRHVNTALHTAEKRTSLLATAVNGFLKKANAI